MTKIKEWSDSHQAMLFCFPTKANDLLRFYTQAFPKKFELK
jgi:hypothetical protein